MLKKDAKNCLLFLFLLSIFFVRVELYADVILHAFNWPYLKVANHADEIKKLGYKKVLVSPAYKSSGNQWWSLYQPQDYRLIENHLGNTDDFKYMVQKLSKLNINVYADIVFNHMANESQIRSDLNYPGKVILKNYATRMEQVNSLKLFGNLQFNLFSASDFHSACNINDWNNIQNVQYCRIGNLPDLTDNNWVVMQQQNYLRALKKIGVKGFRIDAVKHINLIQIKKVFTPEITKDMHIFGEIITSGGTNTAEYEIFLKPFITQTNFSAYDFPLFKQIRDAFDYNGSLNNIGSNLNPGNYLPKFQAVTFVVTHDIPNNSGFRYQIMNPIDEQLGYAFIMGRDGGVPLVYTDNNESGDKRWINAFKKENIKKMIKFHNIVLGKSMQVISSDACHVLFSRGTTGLVGINKCVDSIKINLPQNWKKKSLNFKDMLSLKKFNTKQGYVVLDARKASMWLLKQ